MNEQLSFENEEGWKNRHKPTEEVPEIMASDELKFVVEGLWVSIINKRRGGEGLTLEEAQALVDKWQELHVRKTS